MRSAVPPASIGAVIRGADSAARAVAGGFIVGCIADADRWSARKGGAAAVVTGVPAPPFNGVLTVETDAAPGDVEDLLGRVEATGLTHFLQVREGTDPAIARLAVSRGMTRDEDVPLMVLDDLGALDEELPAELFLRQLEPSEREVHTRVAAEGFEEDFDLLDRYVSPAMMALPGVRCYVGIVDGEPVVTGVGFTSGDSVGIFSVATVPTARRQGFGAALTRRAILDGAAHGASWAYLQSSPAGFRVYERLGFRTVELWSFWVGAASGG